MLFQGQEFGLDRAVPLLRRPRRRARRARAQGAARVPGAVPVAGRRRRRSSASPDPGRDETFARCKLDWSERERHAGARSAAPRPAAPAARRPGLRGARPTRLDGAVLGAEAFVLRFFGDDARRSAAARQPGRDLQLDARARAAARAAAGAAWSVLWSSEDPRYGGSGRWPDRRDRRRIWRLPGRCRGRSSAPAVRDVSGHGSTICTGRCASGRRARRARPSAMLLAASGSSPTASAAMPRAPSPGVLTRRYHGLLVAALPAPARPQMMLNQLGETLRLADGTRRRARRRGTCRRTALDSPERCLRRVPARGRPARLALRRRRRAARKAHLLMPHRQNTVHITYRAARRARRRSRWSCGRPSTSARHERRVDASRCPTPATRSDRRETTAAATS